MLHHEQHLADHYEKWCAFKTWKYATTVKSRHTDPLPRVWPLNFAALCVPPWYEVMVTTKDIKNTVVAISAELKEKYLENTSTLPDFFFFDIIEADPTDSEEPAKLNQIRFMRRQSIVSGILGATFFQLVWVIWQLIVVIIVTWLKIFELR